MASRARLRFAIGLIGLAWLTLPASLAQAGESGATPAAGLQPIASTDWSIGYARHLLFQAGFGGSAAEVAALHKLGPAEAVNRLVDFGRQPALDLPTPSASQPPEAVKPPASATPEERQQFTAKLRREDQQRLAELRAWWLRRMIESPRPLEEKLTLFWHGLFTSGYQTVRSSYAMYQQNELLRRHAAGNYGALLHAIVHDPAMLRYLDNSSNVRGRPNENLARELLELFSMGEGNYSETDIKEGARALTGHTFDRQTWQFKFARFSHDSGTKTVFGQSGDFDGDKLVDLILQQPATARYIVRKLFVFFVHDSPSEATINELAHIFREHGYELSPVLKTIFLSAEFYSPHSAGTHIKSPAELVVGTIRSLPIDGVDYQTLVAALRNMGQDLFEPPNVKGWDGGRTWLSTNWLLARQNFAVGLVTGGGWTGKLQAKLTPKRPGLGKSKLDLVILASREKLTTADQLVAYLSQTLLPTALTADERAELLAALGDLPPADQWSAHPADVNAHLLRLVALILSMPLYQLS
jgi:uncharacterized protein (DUF1800 family)